jgi:hypothetical protein
MTVSDLGGAVSEPRFQERLDRLRATYPSHEHLIRELENFVRSAADDEIVRINPIR